MKSQRMMRLVIEAVCLPPLPPGVLRKFVVGKAENSRCGARPLQPVLAPSPNLLTALFVSPSADPSRSAQDAVHPRAA